MHPLQIVQQVLGCNDPEAPIYKHLQLNGSAWSRWTPYGDRAVTYAKEAAATFMQLGPPDSLRVLCAGCNDGLEMEVFERVGFKTEGFDLDPEKVRVAVYCGLKAKVGDIHDPPYSADIYDGIFCSHTFEHCCDRAKAGTALTTLLKAGGMLFFVVPLEPAYPAHNPSHTGYVIQPEDIPQWFPGMTVVGHRVIDNPEKQVVMLLRKLDGLHNNPEST